MRYSFVALVSALIALCAWLPISSADLLDWILADSFETGNISAWSSSNGYPAVIPLAASEGEYGLRTDVHFEQAFWVQDDTLNNETVIRTDFDLNADGLSMTDGDSFDVYIGWVFEDSFAAFVVSLEKDFGVTGLRITAFDVGGNPASPAPVPIATSGWHRIAVEWGAATGAGDTGELRLFVDGTQQAEIVDIDSNGLDVKAARLGAAGGIDPGTQGHIDLDVYTSVRLFDPWPCVRASGANPTNGGPVCLDGEGRNTAIASGGCGNGVVAWEGLEDLTIIRSPRSRLGGIYGKKVSGASGRQTDGPFTITEDERATTPDIAMDNECNSVVVWKTDLETEAIYAAVFDVDGALLTDPVIVGAGADLEELPVVGAGDDGRFFVAWRRDDGRAQSIWGRHFQANASPTDAAFQLDPGSGAVSAPGISTNASGRTVVVWDSDEAISAVLLDDNGAQVDDVVVTSGPGDSEAAVAAMDDGGFAAVWIRETTDRRVFMRLFDESGGPITGEIRVDTQTPADCSTPGVEIGPDGGITVVWSSLFDGHWTIRGRRFTGEGSPDGSEFVIESAGPVWLPTRPDISAAERLIFSFSEETDPYGYARGSLVGAFTIPDLFFDGFEDGTTNAWSVTVP